MSGLKHYDSEGGFGAGVIIAGLLLVALAYRDDPGALALQLPKAKAEARCSWRAWPEGGRDEQGVTIMKYEENCE